VIDVPLTNKRTTVVPETLFTHVFVTHGIPKTVRLDEGKEFVNDTLLRLYQQWGEFNPFSLTDTGPGPTQWKDTTDTLPPV
jgi:hypothetical protein